MLLWPPRCCCEDELLVTPHGLSRITIINTTGAYAEPQCRAGGRAERARALMVRQGTVAIWAQGKEEVAAAVAVAAVAAVGQPPVAAMIAKRRFPPSPNPLDLPLPPAPGELSRPPLRHADPACRWDHGRALAAHELSARREAWLVHEVARAGDPRGFRRHPGRN